MADALARREVCLTCPPDDVDHLHQFLRAAWHEAPFVGEQDRLRFETALVELAGNIVEHGARDRAIRCVVAIAVSSRRLCATVEDTGRAVDLPTEDAPPDPLAEDGRGLWLIRRLVDVFTYERVGLTNRWSLSRHLDQID